MDKVMIKTPYKSIESKPDVWAHTAAHYINSNMWRRRAQVSWSHRLSEQKRRPCLNDVWIIAVLIIIIIMSGHGVVWPWDSDAAGHRRGFRGV